MSVGKPSAGQPNAQLIWLEYRYRHDLRWKLIFQIPTAVVVLSVVPYVEQDVAAKLRGWIVALPGIAIALAAFGWFQLRKELDGLDWTRSKHRTLQDRDSGSGDAKRDSSPQDRDSGAGDA
jgi:hypothetical protein